MALYEFVYLNVGLLACFRSAIFPRFNQRNELILSLSLYIEKKRDCRHGNKTDEQ